MAQEITNAAATLNHRYTLLSFAFSKKWVSMTLLGISLCLGMMLAGWGMVEFGLWGLNSYRTELAQLKQDCRTQRETLANLKSETWGLELMELENGHFLVFPVGKKPGSQIWTIGDRKAVRME